MYVKDLSMGFRESASSALLVKVRLLMSKYLKCLRVSRTSFHSARHYKNQGVVRLLSRWNSQRQKREQPLQR